MFWENEKRTLFHGCLKRKLKNKEEKVYLLGFMTYKLALVSMNYEEEDDRDSYVNKRIETTGILLNNLFRNYFNKLVFGNK